MSYFIMCQHLKLVKEHNWALQTPTISHHAATQSQLVLNHLTET